MYFEAILFLLILNIFLANDGRITDNTTKYYCCFRKSSYFLIIYIYIFLIFFLSFLFLPIFLLLFNLKSKLIESVTKHQNKINNDKNQNSISKLHLKKKLYNLRKKIENNFYYFIRKLKSFEIFFNYMSL